MMPAAVRLLGGDGSVCVCVCVCMCGGTFPFVRRPLSLLLSFSSVSGHMNKCNNVSSTRQPAWRKRGSNSGMNEE